MATTRFVSPPLPAPASQAPVVPHLLPGSTSRRTLATALAAALTLGPAAFAQESEGEKRSVRVLVLGDGQVEVREDGETARILEELAPSTENETWEIARHIWPTLPRWGGAYLGVDLVNLNEPLRAHFGVPEGSGVLVSNVVEDGPAASAGVRVGDILTRFNGEDVTSSRRLVSLVRREEAGGRADLEVWRDGKVETLGTTLAERPRPDLGAGSFSFAFRGREDFDGDGEIDVFVAPEDVHEKIQEYFHGDEWKQRHERVQRFLHERRPDMKALEDRLDALKERLAELERRLDNEN